jgi:ubiquinone/menaquinone biosynthesis C-methylase UbiE
MHPHQGGLPDTRGFAHPARNVAVLGIEPGMKVADFGSGSGAYVNLIAGALLGSGTVYAVDIQKDLLRRIKNEAERHGHKNVEILWGDLEEEGGSKLNSILDLVLVSNLLFQVRDKEAVLIEAARVLKPNGRVAIIDWAESFGGMGPTEEMVVSKEAAYECARKAGLTFVKEFPAGAHHYGLIFRKTATTARRA